MGGGMSAATAHGPAGNLAAITIGILCIRNALFNQVAGRVEVEIYADDKLFVLHTTPERALSLSEGFRLVAERAMKGEGA
jgi:hypothetical protein